MFYDVKKVENGFAVTNWNNIVEIVYKNKKDAENYANGASYELINGADEYDIRRDYIISYLEERENRAPSNEKQYELF